MKRVKVKPECPNPLFVSWLEAWKEDAKSRGSEMQYCFGKALNTLKKFPLPLKSGRECLILENFGPKLCDMLDKKLTNYKAANNENSASSGGGFCLEYEELGIQKNSSNLKRDADKDAVAKIPGIFKRVKNSETKEQPAKKTKIPRDKDDGRKASPSKNGPYIPVWRSGGYAILLTLYEKTQDPDYLGYMGKADLQADAQKHCDNSLRKPEPGTRYSAWSAMAILIAKGLVINSNKPAKYRLTDAGLAVAMKLLEVDENNSASQSSSKSNSSDQSSESAVSLREKRLQHQISEEDFNLGCNEGGILPYNNNNQNVSKENKTATSGEKKIENHSQILDIKERNESQQSTSSGEERTIILRPQSFDVILLVDNRETAGGKTRPEDDATIAELKHAKLQFQVCNLKIGDFAWIARCSYSGEELILPHIVERKRMDDFGGSIKDGRYHEQKFRLKKSGIQNITYLIEHHGNNQFSGLPLTTLFQAATNTLVQDGFTVKYTKSHRESMFYLASMTEMLTKIYKKKTLVGCKKEDVMPTNTGNDLIQLMVFKDFNKAAAKTKNFRTKEMFIKHLIQLKGISVEKAVAIVDSYPTPTALKKAFDDAGFTGENLLAGVQFGSTKRQLGPALSKTLHQFYTRKDF